MSDYHITMDCILIFTSLCCEATKQPSVVCLAEFQIWRETIKSRGNRGANNGKNVKCRVCFIPYIIV